MPEPLQHSPPFPLPLIHPTMFTRSIIRHFLRLPLEVDRATIIGQVPPSYFIALEAYGSASWAEEIRYCGAGNGVVAVARPIVVAACDAGMFFGE